MTRTSNLVASIALALVASACGSAAKQGEQPATTTTGLTTTTLPSTSSTAPTSTSTTTTTTMPAMPLDVKVYFMRGDQLGVAHRVVDGRAPATAAVHQLLAGPTAAEAAAGLGTAIPAGTRLLGINIVGGLATVDLTGPFSSGGGSLSMTARLAQVTYTLTQFRTVSGVGFRLDGRAVTVFGGEGIVLDHPATRSSFESVTPAILVETPAVGDRVSSPAHLSGTANVFEAAFRVEIADGSGRVLVDRPVMATSGTGTRGTFDVRVTFSAPSGPGRLTVYDLSAKDGSRQDVVTVPIQLVAG